MPTYGFILKVSGIDLDDDYEWRAVERQIPESLDSYSTGVDKGEIIFQVSGEKTTALAALRRMHKKLTKMNIRVKGLVEGHGAIWIGLAENAEIIDKESAKIFAAEIKADTVDNKKTSNKQIKQTKRKPAKKSKPSKKNSR